MSVDTMNRDVPNIALIGIQGAGKGTQAPFIAERYDLQILESGKMFREVRNGPDSPIKEEVLSFMDQGKLVPDETTMKMVGARIAALGDQPYLLDGVPRNTAQLRQLFNILEENRQRIIGLHLEMSDDEVTCRIAKRVEEAIARGEEPRKDDANPEAVKERIRTYNEMTRPILDVMEERGTLIEVSATAGNPEEVFALIREKLEMFAPELADRVKVGEGSF